MVSERMKAVWTAVASSPSAVLFLFHRVPGIGWICLNCYLMLCSIIIYKGTCTRAFTETEWESDEENNSKKKNNNPKDQIACAQSVKDEFLGLIIFTGSIHRPPEMNDKPRESKKREMNMYLFSSCSSTTKSLSWPSSETQLAKHTPDSVLKKVDCSFV